LSWVSIGRIEAGAFEVMQGLAHRGIVQHLDSEIEGVSAEINAVVVPAVEDGIDLEGWVLVRASNGADIPQLTSTLASVAGRDPLAFEVGVNGDRLGLVSSHGEENRGEMSLIVRKTGGISKSSRNCICKIRILHIIQTELTFSSMEL